MLLILTKYFFPCIILGNNIISHIFHTLQIMKIFFKVRILSQNALKLNHILGGLIVLYLLLFQCL